MSVTATTPEGATGFDHKSEFGDPPRILVLRHRCEPVALYGGPVYTASILRLLAGPEFRATLRELSFEAAPSRPVHLLRNLLAMARALVSPLPAKVLRFRSGRFQRRLLRLLAHEAFDLVLISGLEMMWCRRLVAGKAPVLYLCHNLEGDLYWQQVRRLPAVPLLGSIARRDARKLDKFERREVAGADAIVTIAARDRDALTGAVPKLTVPPVFAYPRWDGEPPAAVTDTAPVRLGFLGNLGWWPNQAAIKWFLTAVWPETPGRFELHLFGRGSECLMHHPRVTGHGHVAELRHVWACAHLMIQPIVIAAGLNIKVAETAYNRRPMLATRAALEGCDLEPDPAIVVADDARAWVEFLRGPGPARLMTLRVSRANADRFTATHNARPLACFTRSVITRFRSTRGRSTGGVIGVD